MSFTVNGNKIKLTRGDTLRTVVTITKDGELYTPADGDVIKFTVKKNASDTVVLISKTVPHDTMELHLEPTDTKNLAVGTYKYDMEIIFANGDVNTFITSTLFEITEEIGT